MTTSEATIAITAGFRHAFFQLHFLTGASSFVENHSETSGGTGMIWTSPARAWSKARCRTNSSLPRARNTALRIARSSIFSSRIGAQFTNARSCRDRSAGFILAVPVPGWLRLATLEIAGAPVPANGTNQTALSRPARKFHDDRIDPSKTTPAQSVADRVQRRSRWRAGLDRLF